MKRFSIFFLVLLMIFLGSGCKKPKRGLLGKLAGGKQVVTEIESVELAEAILWAKPHRFSLPRDPFKPLVGESSLLAQEDIELSSQPDIDIKVLGILKMEGGSIALLGLPSGVGIVRERDKVGAYMVEKISSDRVILEREGKSRILEMEDEE